jgi:hypothetical protein
MNEAKYIIVNGCVVVFSSALTHKDVAQFSGLPVESAGFVNFNVEKDSWGEDVAVAHTYGKSESLGIGSRKEDSGMITRQICSRY